jgi:hypothetical protein
MELIGRVDIGTGNHAVYVDEQFLESFPGELGPSLKLSMESFRRVVVTVAIVEHRSTSSQWRCYAEYVQSVEGSYLIFHPVAVCPDAGFRSGIQLVPQHSPLGRSAKFRVLYLPCAVSRPLAIPLSARASVAEYALS